MAQRQRGWRSARWSAGIGNPNAATLPLPSPVQVVGRRTRSQSAPPPQASPGALSAYRHEWPWQGVQWSIGYIAFLGYIVSIITYALPIGSASMIIAMLAITLGSKDRWNVPMSIALPLGAFVLIAFLGYRATRFTSYRFNGYEPIIDLIKVLIICFVMISVLSTWERVRFFIFVYLAAFGLYPVRGAIFNFFIYHAATQGRVSWNYIFENPNDLATLVMLPLALSLGAFHNEPNKWVKRAAMVGLGLIPLTIFMSQSRGGILALIVGVLVIFMGYKRGRVRLVIGGIIVTVGLVIFAPSSVWTRLANTQSAVGSGNLSEAEDSHSAEQRMQLWKLGIRVASDFPITGVGWDAYPYANAFYARAAIITKEEAIARGARDVHNTYLRVLAETGLVGLGVWLSAVFFVVVGALTALKRLRQMQSPFAETMKLVLVALLCFGIAGIFGSFAHLAFTYVQLALLVSMTLLTRRDWLASRAPGART
jgi:O-antigen ligase